MRQIVRSVFWLLVLCGFFAANLYAYQVREKWSDEKARVENPVLKKTISVLVIDKDRNTSKFDTPEKRIKHVRDSLAFPPSNEEIANILGLKMKVTVEVDTAVKDSNSVSE
jgi:hypothetical protein